MAITADVNVGNGLVAQQAYIVVNFANVVKGRDAITNEMVFRLIYQCQIYQNQNNRNIADTGSYRIRCPRIDKFKIVYDPTTNTNPFVLAYNHLKANSDISDIMTNVSDS